MKQTSSIHPVCDAQSDSCIASVVYELTPGTNFLSTVLLSGLSVRRVPLPTESVDLEEVDIGSQGYSWPRRLCSRGDEGSLRQLCLQQVQTMKELRIQIHEETIDWNHCFFQKQTSKKMKKMTAEEEYRLEIWKALQSSSSLQNLSVHLTIKMCFFCRLKYLEKLSVSCLE